MLEITRAVIETSGIPYAEDPTNPTNQYQRNRIRHEVLPRLEVESAGAVSHLAALASRASEELALIDALCEALSLEEADLGDLPVEMAALIVRWRANRELPRAVRPRSPAVEQAAQLLVHRAMNATTSLGKGWAASTSEGRLTFVPDEDSREGLVLPSPGSYRLPHVTVELIPANRVEDNAGVDHKLNVWLRADQVRWPLKLTREPAQEEGPRGWFLRDAPGTLLWRSDKPTPNTEGDLLFRMIFSS